MFVKVFIKYLETNNECCFKDLCLIFKILEIIICLNYVCFLSSADHQLVLFGSSSKFHKTCSVGVITCGLY